MKRRHLLATAVATVLAVAVTLLGPLAPEPVAAATSCTPTGGANNCLLFSFSGGAESFTVPAGVTSIQVTLNGAGGGNGAGGAISQGGQTTGTVAVTPGNILAITVGRFGDYGGTPAYGGGGAGGGCFGAGLCGQGGGGLTGLWANNTAFDRGSALLIAGGGGGSGGATNAGGVGGGAVGANGANGTVGGGAGGTATAAGFGGSEFTGGNGTGSTSGGGGGGGGWYGGGNGFGTETPTGASGGGGGSGYIGGAGVTAATTTPGAGAVANDNGSAIIQWTAPATQLTTPVSGAVSNQQTPAMGGTGSAGNTVTVTDGPGGPSVCTVTVQPNGAWSCTPGTPLIAGAHTLIATETNPGGFFYPASSPSTYTVDLTPPAAPTINAPSTTENTSPTLSGTSDAGTAVTIRNADGATVCMATATTQSTWSCTPVTPFPLGANPVTPTAVNTLGNSAIGAVFVVTVVEPPPAPEPPVPEPGTSVPPSVRPPASRPPQPAPTPQPEVTLAPVPAETNEPAPQPSAPSRAESLPMNLRFPAAQLTPGTVTSMRGTLGPNASAEEVTVTFTGRVGQGMIYRTVTVVVDGEPTEPCAVLTREFTCTLTLGADESADIEVRLVADALNAPDTAIQQLAVASSDPQQDNAVTVSTPVTSTSDTDEWASMFQLNMSSLPGAFLPLLALLLLALAASVAEAERRRASPTPPPTLEPGASS
ncbi:Ig-like domain-containing protein [Microbacterium sp. A8/3-1]|uniref:Ig-like domain-containing protein n=1 Tax=Microbacterium sp. A8/3-1 TaxID=3160749 RepID=A0AAU7W498_9MICO